MVEATGFEPAALCSQSRCATKLRYASICEYILFFVLWSPSCGSQNRFFGLGRRAILTAAPFHPPFISRRERSGSMPKAEQTKLCYASICEYILFFVLWSPSCGSQNRFFGLGRRAILTAAPFHPPFISHRERSGSMPKAEQTKLRYASILNISELVYLKTPCLSTVLTNFLILLKKNGCSCIISCMK